MLIAQADNTMKSHDCCLLNKLSQPSARPLQLVYILHTHTHIHIFFHLASALTHAAAGDTALCPKRLFNLTKINSSNVNDNVAELMCICLCLTSYFSLTSNTSFPLLCALLCMPCVFIFILFRV